MSLFQKILNFIRSKRTARPVVHMNPQVEYEIPHQQPPEINFPPGTQLSISDEKTVVIEGLPGVRFTKGTVKFIDDNGGTMSKHVVRQTLLGCGCVASGPHEIAYISDISGVAVCRRCAWMCVCGHRVAPHERIEIAPGQFMCRVCQAVQQKALKRHNVIKFIFGAFLN